MKAVPHTNLSYYIFSPNTNQFYSSRRGGTSRKLEKSLKYTRKIAGFCCKLWRTDSLKQSQRTKEWGNAMGTRRGNWFSQGKAENPRLTLSGQIHSISTFFCQSFQFLCGLCFSYIKNNPGGIKGGFGRILATHCGCRIWIAFSVPSFFSFRFSSFRLPSYLLQSKRWFYIPCFWAETPIL